MTQHDLIVGHFEGTLSTSQEAELQTLLQSSPDARTAYQNHSAMQETLEEDSRRMIPPVGLREATIGAALGTAVQTITGGIGAWLSTKVAMVIGTLVAGGIITGVVLYNNDSSDQTAADQTEQSVSIDKTQAPVGDEPVPFGEEATGSDRSGVDVESGVYSTRNANGARTTDGNASVNGSNPEAIQNGSAQNEDEDPQVELGQEPPTEMEADKPIRVRSQRND